MKNESQPGSKEHHYRGSLEHIDLKPEKRGLTTKQKLGIGILAVITAVGGGSVAANALRQDHPTKTEAPANPGQTQPSSSETAPATVENPETVNAATMENYKQMDVATFDLLPQDERLLYSQSLLDKTVSLGNYSARYGEGGFRHDYEITPITVSLDNTGKEIVDSNLYCEQLAYILCGNRVDGSASTPDAEKALSSVFYEVGDNNFVSNGYRATVKQMETMTTPGTMTDKYTVTKTSDLIVGVDKNNEKVQYKNVTYMETSGSQTTNTRFIYHEFINYKGEKQALWLVDISENTLEDLNSSSTVLK